MSKLTKQAEADHREACRLVDLQRELSEEEKEFVLEHWQESAQRTSQCRDGAFFTPSELASEFTLHVSGSRVIDLGAGIGALAFACHRALMFAHRFEGLPVPDIVCVERNPEYVRVGLRVLPEAVWICEDLLRVPPMRLRPFDTAVSNPPYGPVPRCTDAPGYRGSRCEYHTIAVAAQIAARGVFLIPQQSAPFAYSGRTAMRFGTGDAEYTRFCASTGITLRPTCGIDTAYYRNQWRHRPPPTELVCADFTAPTVLRPTRDLRGIDHQAS
ncbi:methyltransferase [Nocardia uniformis]|uniref:Methyltransferase n=1 Tax=Nocardia uniformis TaxID=53432 RepID=A0A849CBV8_9NOCA|nr:methyltransferase [Nocardia uniformis]NNH73785.1 methyltransferase [Nocardia uniformis]